MADLGLCPLCDCVFQRGIDLELQDRWCCNCAMKRGYSPNECNQCKSRAQAGDEARKAAEKALRAAEEKKAFKMAQRQADADEQEKIRKRNEELEAALREQQARAEAEKQALLQKASEHQSALKREEEARLKLEAELARLAVGGPSGSASAGLTSFGASNFKRFYEQREPVAYFDELMLAIRSVVLSYCEFSGLDAKVGLDFFAVLQKEAFEAPDALSDLLGKIAYAAQRVWTSGKRMGGKDSREFCSILNAAIRRDDARAMPFVATFARAVNELCVVRGARDASALKFPPDGALWRGGGLPDAHRGFYAPGVRYRVPGFLASSMSRDVAYNFYYQAYDQGLPAVLWRVQLDPRGQDELRYRCKHVNLVSRSHFGDSEAEFLFAPYSAFEVVSVQWSARPDDDTPHEVTIRAALDNRKEPEDLPLAPWY
eukprot:CAMPEP_0113703336 /NCGR_PEP_ID=MMETSP0038_2-20120614/25793_1 /TAXON_ID=2898 /ORGANISM="Cryptomonas paramecium" /LENGTH=428 /DNA_ID=CAMNT_0000627767 /DNA_START=800 /DNA_END=2086 /DNA_ORIENTATION=+ /assembly_acc=CAM_ASM_000170